MGLPQGYRTEGVKCPHCGKDYKDIRSVKLEASPITKGAVTMGIAKCEGCGQKFMVEQTEVQIYKTTKVDS